MQRTPSKVGDRIDQIIDKLNATWDLQIERLHGTDARRAGESSELSRKCASRIRALCWRENVNIEGVIDDFEERAASKCSGWIYKPSQETGTLLSLPQSKSFLKNATITKARYTTEGRLEALQLLADLLDEEHKLSQESESFSRTSAAHSVAPSRNASFGSTRSGSTTSFVTARSSVESLASIRTASISKTPMKKTATSSKKRKNAPNAEEKHEPKKLQTNITKHFLKQSIQPNPSASSPNTSLRTSTSITQQRRSHGPSEAVLQQTSFDSTRSDPAFQFSDDEHANSSSNDTSVLSDLCDKRESQYSGGTQLDNELANNLSISRSLELADEINYPIQEILKDLPNKGPFSQFERRSLHGIPFLFNWELHRHAKILGVSTSKIFRLISEINGNERPDFETYWTAVKSLYRNPKFSTTPLALPAKSDICSWASEDNTFCDCKSGKSMYLSGTLSFAESESGRLFEFTLKPTKQDVSCRLHRKWGADRFLTLDLPYFDRRSLPAHLKKLHKNNEIHEAVYRWLGSTDLNIAGRTWRAFYQEAIKSKSRKKRREESAGQRLHLFAIDGYDFAPKDADEQLKKHRPVPLVDLLQWHTALRHNPRSSDMKLFARWALALSKTIPTVVLETHEFVKIDDMPARNPDGTALADGTIMTDGCARMSLPLAKAIYYDHLKGTGNLPCAFQARIGGAKGLWIVDFHDAHPKIGDRGYWIEIRPSQLKIKPHPRDRRDADDTQRTFEVVKTSSRCFSAHLNIQLINILHNRGILRSSLRDAVYADWADYLETLSTAMANPEDLLVWRQRHHPLPSGRRPITFCGGMPDLKEHELDMMIDSGFNASDCWYMVKCLRQLLKQAMDVYVDRLRIEVPHSTTVFCVPDPCGVLKAGEIQLNFSVKQNHPVTGLPENYLRNLDRVLVSRNPAHLASDIQAVIPAYYEELRHLEDVVIFSTQGRQPLADLLSGGDYDGDTVTVIWEPSLTKRFINVEKPQLPDKATCGIQSDTRLIAEIFDLLMPKEAQIDDYLQRCLALNGVRSKLGEVTVEHETQIYWKPSSMTEPGPIRLAALAGNLVDAPKQGDSFSDESWRKQRSWTRAKIKVLDEPAYKEGSKTIPSRMPAGECVNIIDYLKFDVTHNLRETVLANFHQKYGTIKVALDPDVSFLYTSQRARAESLASIDPDSSQALIATLNKLKGDLSILHSQWTHLMGTEEDDIVKRELEGSRTARNAFSSKIALLSQAVDAIEPLNITTSDVDHKTKPFITCDIRHEFERDGGGPGTRWSLLRASAMHYLYRGSSMTWKLVGDEMCRLKARSVGKGRTWEMTLRMRALMKVDAKRVGRGEEVDEDVTGVDLEGVDDQ